MGLKYWQVSLKDIERHNSYLADSIATNFYRLYPFLCLAVKNFLKDRVRFFFPARIFSGVVYTALEDLFSESNEPCFTARRFNENFY